MTSDKNSLILYDKNFQIISLLEKGGRYGGEIWQQHDLHKQPLEISNFQTDLEHQQFILDLHSEIHVDEDQSLNFNLFFRRIFFVLEPYHFKQGGTRLWLNFPATIMALNRRVSPRYVFDISEVLMVELKIGNEVVLGKLQDVSETGVAVILSFKHKEQFDLSQKVELLSIDQRSINGDGRGVIRNCSTTHSSHGHLRIGIEIADKLHEGLFSYLKRKSSFVLPG